jgi:AcrR family transcriptional regulator
MAVMTTERAGNDAARSLVRSQTLLWEGTGPRTRGPKPGLTLERIVDSAIAVADAEGIDAVSMRRVARELGAGTMSLYRYVPGKEELLILMLDRVSANTVLPSAEALSWREALARIARTTYQMYLSHPWLLKINWTRPVFGPNTLAGVESFIAAVDRLGLTSQQRVMVMLMMDSYVTGMARSHVLYASAAEETGLSDDEFWSLQVPILERAMATGNYPAMAALSDDAFDAPWDKTFEFGLARLLDGLELFVTGRERQ